MREERENFMKSGMLSERRELMKVGLEELSIRDLRVLYEKVEVFLEFWKSHSKEVRIIEGNEAYDQIVDERVRPVEERLDLIDKKLKLEEKNWRDQTWIRFRFEKSFIFMFELIFRRESQGGSVFSQMEGYWRMRSYLNIQERKRRVFVWFRSLNVEKRIEYLRDREVLIIDFDKNSSLFMNS